MKKKVLIGMMVGFSLVGIGSVPVANASEYDFNDTFTADNDRLRIDFTLEEKRTVTFFSSSANDGGGFDPLMSLWNVDGFLITSIFDDINTSGSQVSKGYSYDYGISDIFFDVELPIGSYTVIVTQFYNIPNGSDLSKGFYYDSDSEYTKTEGYGTASYFNGLEGVTTGDLEFHILNVDTANVINYTPILNPVPVPGALLLLGSGLTGLLGARLRRKK
jgi:hypothetical protein